MKKPTTYLRMRVLGAIDYANGNSIKQRIQSVSETIFTDEEGNPRKFTWRTISTWLYRYKANGVTELENKVRKDKGLPRKLKPEDLQEAINQILPYFRGKKYNKTAIYRKGIEIGVIKKEQLSATSYYRFIKEYELLNKDSTSNKKRLAFCMQYANQLWQADTMFGPHVKDPTGKMIPAKLIAFIDDATRVICHAEFFFSENIAALTNTLKAAFYKRGVPEQLYVDNGHIYSSKEITLICARVGCILRHAPVRDGAAKGKIERFFNTVRSNFLIQKLDLSSLSILNRQLSLWVEDEYNNKKHSALGMTPIDRFTFDLKRINFLAPGDTTEELFYNEEIRKVKKDNTFSFNSMRFEPTADLRQREITIRFNREFKDKIIVYYKATRIGEARCLNLIANGILRNKYLKGDKKT